MQTAVRAYWQAGEEMVAAHRAARRAEVARLESVLGFLDAYPQPEPPATRADERTVPAGGQGAGETGEWVALDVGTLLGMSSPAAWHLVRDAANLRSRHPRLWAAFADLRVEEWQARRVARMCAELGADAARWVDEQLADVWGTAAWNRILRRVEGLVTRADKELAARRARKEQRDRFMTIRHLGDSTSMIVARVDTAAALHLQETIGRMTDEMVADGAGQALPFLRARALEELATPRVPDGDAAPSSPAPHLPLADLVVHIAAEDLDPQVAGSGLVRVTAAGGDVGPVLLEQVAHLLGHRRVRVFPVMDMSGDPGVDGYEIPDRIRRQLLIREEYSVFPYSTARSRSCDLDHTVAYRRAAPGSPAPPGQTRVSNLGPLARREHRAKTARAWRLDQPAPGLYVWTDRAGRRWALVGGHTHRLPDTAPDDQQFDTVMPGMAAFTAAPRPSWQPRVDLVFA